MFVTGLEYQFVKSQMGKQLILIGGYTFSKNSQGGSWVCSTKNPKCKAKLKTDTDGKIISLNNEHAHPPRRYYIVNGEYVRV